MNSLDPVYLQNLAEFREEWVALSTEGQPPLRGGVRFASPCAQWSAAAEAAAERLGMRIAAETPDCAVSLDLPQTLGDAPYRVLVKSPSFPADAATLRRERKGTA